jgi:hypothetical protein
MVVGWRVNRFSADFPFGTGIVHFLAMLFSLSNEASLGNASRFFVAFANMFRQLMLRASQFNGDFVFLPRHDLASSSW